MTGGWVLEGGAGLAIAVFVGTIVEYGVHRLMHVGKMMSKHHAEHHQDGWGQGWLGEFREYTVGSLPVIITGSLIGSLALGSPASGIGFVIGSLLYTAVAAYAHQVQHECPELIFWMPQPVHHIHHTHHMWRHNFGITVDIWDRVFRTYKKVDWAPDRSKRIPLAKYFDIHWASSAPESLVEASAARLARKHPSAASAELVEAELGEPSAR